MVQTILPYRQLMTPKWIYKHSTIFGPHAVYTRYLKIYPTTGVKWQHGLQQQLVPPGVLSSTDSVTVTITVAMDTVLADSRNDHDPSFGIGDGTFFNGFTLFDKGNYGSTSPCHFIEGVRGNNTLENIRRGSGPTTSSRQYSSTVKIQIRPTEQWGSCDTEHGEGYTNIGTYQRRLNLSKGLYLEMYRHDAYERYNINYLMVEIDID